MEVLITCKTFTRNILFHTQSIDQISDNLSLLGTMVRNSKKMELSARKQELSAQLITMKQGEDR